MIDRILNSFLCTSPFLLSTFEADEKWWYDLYDNHYLYCFHNYHPTKVKQKKKNRCTDFSFSFEEKKIVHQIDDGTGISKYALCESGCNCEIDQDLHLHFHCNNCNETVCLTEHKIPQIKVPDGFVSENVNLVVKGICDKCSGQ